MLSALAASLALVLAAPPPKTHAFTVQDLLAMQRLADPQVSPDGKWVVFEVATPDLEANKSRKDLWLAAVDGSAVRQVTSHEANDTNPRWMPDGKSIVFLSARTGSSQVWQISLDGGEARQLSRFPIDVDTLKPFPDGRRFLLSMEVYPELPPSEALEGTAKRAAAEEKPDALAYDSLLYRHWDTWEDGRRSHLFVWSPGSAPLDLMPGLRADCPTKPMGGPEDYSLSPDGKDVVFTIKEPKDAAFSTDLNLYRVSTTGGKAVALTAENKAYDGSPVISPDGKTVAYLMMVRPTFEADRRRVVLLDLASGNKRVLTEAWDRAAEDLLWAPDGKTLYVTADNLGHHGIYAVSAASGEVRPLIERSWNTAPALAGERLVFGQDSLRAPLELFSMSLDGKDVKQLTRFNAERLEAAPTGAAEQFSFTGAKGDTVYGWLVKPASFSEKKRYPVALVVHGGPQGSFGDHWHYRWNAQTFANAGYGVLLIDFHGSTGYGQAFTDAISGDWGGAPYEDLIKGLDFALKKYPFLDGGKACALGASYGGYMINWIAGQTDRFKCLVNHDGLFDLTADYYETEELWFPEWEFGGTPYDKPENFEKHNPKNHVAKWKTPLLVVHGGKDYRVVDTQGLASFTAAQRRGVPSRLLYFPGENHWVLKPKNAVRWYGEVLGWLGKWTGR